MRLLRRRTKRLGTAEPDNRDAASYLLEVLVCRYQGCMIGKRQRGGEAVQEMQLVLNSDFGGTERQLCGKRHADDG